MKAKFSISRKAVVKVLAALEIIGIVVSVIMTARGEELSLLNCIASMMIFVGIVGMLLIAIEIFIEENKEGNGAAE